MTYFQKIFASSLIVFCGATFAADAQAAECPLRNEMLTVLTERFGETRRAIALDTRGIVEIFASDETGTWSVTLSLPSGRTCLIASGEYWTENPGAPVIGLAS